MEERQVSFSEADKDAAMTLLTAKNVVVQKKKSSNGNQGGTTDTTDGGGSSDGSLAGRSAGKRVPKPPRWHAYELGDSVQSNKRPGKTYKKDRDIEWMEKHLATISIGKRVGEPLEKDSILNDGLEQMAGTDCHQAVDGYHVVDLNAYSQQSLYEMALLTEKNSCMPPVLEKRAGVKQSKVSSFTGLDAHRKNERRRTTPLQKATRRQSSVDIKEMSIKEKEKLVQEITKAWKSENHHVWNLVGRTTVPTVNRREINYLRLLLVVREHGGYDASIRDKSWSDIARKFHMEESNIGKNGSSLRLLYKQFILPLVDLLEKYVPLE